MGGRDDEFAEYVELRWSRLYRFAARHVGEERAEEVVRAGLLAAYDVWPDVVESGSRDAYVEQLVLDQIAERPRAEPALLPDARDELPPLPPVDDLLAEAHRVVAGRRRRRTRISAAVAVVVVAAAVLVAATDENPTSLGPPGQPGVPSRMSQVPVGTPPRTPYTSDNVLDFGPAAVTLPRAPVALTRAGSDLVIGYADGRLERFDPASGTRSLLASDFLGDPVADVEGRWVAWHRAGPVANVVEVVSLVGPIRYRQKFPVTTTCCDERLVIHGITVAGQLIASTPGDGRTWEWELDLSGRPGPLHRVEGLDRLAVIRVVGDRVVVADRAGRSTETTVGTVTGHRFRPQYSTERAEPDFTVPGWLIYTARDGTIRARRMPSPGSLAENSTQEVTLRLPPYMIRTTLRRELGTTVVMDVWSAAGSDPRISYLVRCDIATGSCQNLARLVGPHHLAG